jgi:hypothetical protein
MKFSALKTKLLLYFPIIFIVGFLIAIPNLQKPSLATVNCPTSASDNCATGLTTTVGSCGPTGKFDVTFNWAPEATAFTPTTQWLDYDLASPMGSAFMVGKDVGPTANTFTYSDKFAPNTKYFWRINTDWSSLGAGALWSPSLEGSFTTTNCAAPPPAGTPACVFSPNPINPGQQLGIIPNNFTIDPIPVRVVSTFSGAASELGTIPKTGGSVAIPNLTGPFLVRLGPVGSDTTCTGTLTINGTGGATTAQCGQGSPKTDSEAVDAESKCRIIFNIYDDKATTFNIIAGLGDGFYKMLSGKSRLYPQTNGVTAGMGALASSGTMVAALYSHPPVSGVEYLASEFNKFNPVAPVYAQAGGIGFNALQPVQTIWESFRNIAYVGFVLVFVIIGFMIMFRAHISPQAVATVQDSLPRIVIALFLVTFSYAIAGFMIDAMFLLLNVIINALPGGDKQFVFHKSVFGAILGSWKETFGMVSDALTTIIGNVADLGFLDKLLKYFGGTIGALVVGIGLLFVMFKVFIMLLTAYAYIVILTITAPFFFLAQALPGNNSGSTWFKQMAANVAVFPVVAIMFIFAGILGGIQNLGGAATGAIQSSNIGTVGNFPLLSGDIDPNAIGKLIAVGILLMTPGAAELVKNAIGTKGPGGGGGGGAGAALAAGAAVVAAGPRSIAQSKVGTQVGQAAARHIPIVNKFYKGPGTSGTDTRPRS